MKVIIIEDEPIATKKLIKMLQDIDDSIEVLASLESVEESVNWLKLHDKPDLAFLDIQLSDNLSFDIFEKATINFPVIFITAFDEHIMKSFEYNSIDYLLKPVKTERLKKALEKVKLLEWHFLQNKISQLLNENSLSTKTFKSRYVVKKGIDFVSINVLQIAYFFSEHKISFLKDTDGNKYIVDKTLSALMEELDPSKFFRINRKFIAGINAIKKFKSEDGKIIVSLAPTSEETITISKENAPHFRSWIGQ